MSNTQDRNEQHNSSMSKSMDRMDSSGFTWYILIVHDTNNADNRFLVGKEIDEQTLSGWKFPKLQCRSSSPSASKRFGQYIRANWSSVLADKMIFVDRTEATLNGEAIELNWYSLSDRSAFSPLKVGSRTVPVVATKKIETLSGVSSANNASMFPDPLDQAITKWLTPELLDKMSKAAGLEKWESILGWSSGFAVVVKFSLIEKLALVYNRKVISVIDSCLQATSPEHVKNWLDNTLLGSKYSKKMAYCVKVREGNMIRVGDGVYCVKLGGLSSAVETQTQEFFYVKKIMLK